ncbi:MAG: hypothetical protein WC175_05720 [Candidatus Dojkabacteria bacterium]
MPPTTEQFLLFCNLVNLGKEFQHSNSNFNRSLRRLEASKVILEILENIYSKVDIIFSVSFLDVDFFNSIPLNMKKFFTINNRAITADELSEFKSCLLVLKNKETLDRYLTHLRKFENNGTISIEVESNDYTQRIFFKVK